MKAGSAASSTSRRPARSGCRGMPGRMPAARPWRSRGICGDLAKLRQVVLTADLDPDQELATDVHVHQDIRTEVEPRGERRSWSSAACSCSSTTKPTRRIPVNRGLTAPFRITFGPTTPQSVCPIPHRQALAPDRGDGPPTSEKPGRFSASVPVSHAHRRLVPSRRSSRTRKRAAATRRSHSEIRYCHRYR